ncbi:MAG: hypothetical protein P8R54_24465, partial [Myxococcota bacterium]|nr:hypothetical protein [Myxococcota bacterium]
MNRVEAAVNEGRCVLAIGGRALKNPDVLMELRRRPVPAVALGADPVNPVGRLSEEALAPALDNRGGIIVLVEPEGAVDGRALSALSELVKKGKNKPKLYVAARAFNPFAMPMSMRLLKIEQLKSRAQDFVASLPIPSASAVAAAPVSRKQKQKSEAARIPAPRAEIVGREEELAALKALLESDGGPIVMTGAAGSGRRWLLESVLSDSELVRLPDFAIDRGCGADTLAAIVARAAADGGDATLLDALTAAKRSPGDSLSPADLTEKFVAALSSDAMSGKLLIVHHLHRLLDRRDSSFYREGRLEMMLRGALLSEPKLRIVFVSERAPTFYREGQSAHIRRFEVGGIRGKELHALFDAWHAPEFPRAHFGPIFERTGGHPMYARYLALAVRRGEDIEDILERPKYLKASAPGDMEALLKHLKKVVSKVDAKLMEKLYRVALFRETVSPEILQFLGINRKERLTLLSDGVLEQTPIAEGRRYYIHPIILSLLPYRKVNDFSTMEEIGRAFLGQGAAAEKRDEPLKAIAFRLEGNRLLVDARRERSCYTLSVPDNDPNVEAIQGLIRRRQPRLDIARSRLNEVLKTAPRNTELLLCDAELKTAEKKKGDEIQAVYDRIAEFCPTPEAVHHECSFHISRNARGKAQAALERGIELFTDSGRLRRRLAGIYLRMNRLELAEQTLRAAADLEPMMPDNYSMLGEVYVRLGVARWEDADQVIAEARRIDPDSPVHMVRSASLLRARAMVDTDSRDALLMQGTELLEEAIKLDPAYGRAMVMLATTILDRETGEDADLDRVQWLLKQSTRRSETAEAATQRARLLIRRAAFTDADRVLDKAHKKEPSYFQVYGVRGELYMAQGDVFKAMEVYKTARERSPRTAPERTLYDAALARIGELIESGQAVAIMKGGEEQAAVSTPEGGTRREPGRTAVRRTADGEIVDVVVAEAPAEAAEAPAEAAEAPAEAAEAPAEAAEAP